MISPHQPVAPLARRALAWTVDHALVIAAAVVLIRTLTGPRPLGTGNFVAVMACAVVIVGWGCFLWWSGARGATPGLRLMGLQVVSVDDGEPLGWLRFGIRLVTVTALAATGIGWPLMLIWLAADRSRRGWHDLTSGAIVLTADTSPAAPEDFAPSINPTPPQQLPSQPWTPTLRAHHPRVLEPTVDHAPHTAPTPEVNHLPQFGVSAHATGPAPFHTAPAEPAPAYHTAPAPYRAPTVPERTGPTFEPTLPAPDRPRPLSAADAGWAPSTDATIDDPGLVLPTMTPYHGSPAPQSTGTPASQPSAPRPSAPQQSPIPAPPPSIAHAPHSALEEDPDRTMLRPQTAGPIGSAPPPPAAPQWCVALPDGREIPLDRPVVLGRRPTQPDGVPVHLVQVADQTRTLSKSHLRVGFDGQSPHVCDLGSTNGSAVVDHNGPHPLVPHQPRRIAAGQLVQFGDHSLVVRAR